MENSVCVGLASWPVLRAGVRAVCAGQNMTTGAGVRSMENARLRPSHSQTVICAYHVPLYGDRKTWCTRVVRKASSTRVVVVRSTNMMGQTGVESHAVLVYHVSRRDSQLRGHSTYSMVR